MGTANWQPGAHRILSVGSFDLGVQLMLHSGLLRCAETARVRPDVYSLAPEGYRASRLLTADVAEELFLRGLYSAYAEIVRRHGHGETLAALAEEFGISQQREWRIMQRYG